MKMTIIDLMLVGLIGSTIVVKGEESGWSVKWKDGIWIESDDKDFKLRMGGRLQYDWTWVSEDNGVRGEFGELQDGSEMRRARFHTSGRLNGVTGFKLQLDWAGGVSSLKDAYIGIDLEKSHLKAGHFKEPFSLDEQTSSKYIVFMEKAPVVSTFSPSRNAGVQLSSMIMDNNITWAVGGFRITDNVGKVIDDDSYSTAARITGTPWYEDNGEKVMHVGVAGGFRKIPDSISFCARPPIHNTNHLLDTDAINGDNVWTWGLESAFVQGPLSIQGELIWASVDEDDSSSSFDGMGWYAQMSYFLTGEHRVYKQKTGAFSGVKPNKNYGRGGSGAWEIAARYDSLDLTDAEAVDGELSDLSLGVNWHLNPSVRLTANYIYTDRENVGDVHFAGTRAQVAF